jgi:hypothetical protein
MTALSYIVLSFMAVVAFTLLLMMLTELLNFVQTRVPFVPTAKADIEDMVSRMGITEQDYVYDLGSGNGKVVFAIEQLTQARTKGLQRGGWTQWYARIKAKLIGSQAQFVTGNFFGHSWGEATVIYAYLYPFLMRSVADKAWEECRPGTKIIVRDFYLPEKESVEIWKTPTGHTMYWYEI